MNKTHSRIQSLMDKQFLELVNKLNNIDLDDSNKLFKVVTKFDKKIIKFEKSIDKFNHKNYSLFKKFWGELIKWLEYQRIVFIGLINYFSFINKGKAINAIKYDVVCGIQTRCLQIFNEIIVLLSHGYPNGAMARWRSLYELQIVLQFLAKNQDDELYKMYYDHCLYSDYTFEKEYRELDIPKYTDNAYQELRIRAEEIESKYEIKIFRKNFGWAYKKLSKVTFEEMEKIAEPNSFLRIFYKESCNRIHSTARGTFNDMGKIGKYDNNDGPSLYGISLPAQLINITLNNIIWAWCSALSFSYDDKLVDFFGNRVDTINKIFADVQGELEREISDYETKI